MKEKYKQIPQPLRKQILLRCAGAGLALAMLLFVLVYSRDWRFFIPCVVAAVLCIASAALLFNRCVRGKYVVITGICTEIERTSIRKRIKALHLQTEEHHVRLVGVRGLRSLSVGETLSLFVADNTPVYSVEGSNVICNYITLSKALPAVKKEIQTQ